MFFRKFLRSPKLVGSIMPSSPFLAEAMVRPVDWARVRTVAELGAGTGVFTRLIEQSKRTDCAVLVFEQDVKMRALLSTQFPSCFLHRDAARLSRATAELGITGLDCVLSGLPFGNFSDEERDLIMDEVCRSLKPGGLFVMFQYSLQMRPRLVRRFASVETAFVPLNIPPAFVHVCHQPALRASPGTSTPLLPDYATAIRP